MSRSERGGGMKLAAVLAMAGVILGWCGFHLYEDVWKSHQHCEMTYVRPNYTIIDLSPHTAAPKFQVSHEEKGVEWRITQITETMKGLRSNNYRLWQYTGDDQGWRRGSGLVLPVLFIPGNGGSYQMARAMASETTRRFSRLGVHVLEPVELVWYMLDLGGEWSAFDGKILEAQVRFALKAMRHLATIHNITAAPPVTSKMQAMRNLSHGRRRGLQQHPGMVVVGHSMGGVVAADALARAGQDPELGPSLAALLVTLGAPHTRAPAPGDQSLESFYVSASARPRPVVPVLSIAGGVADFQVATELTSPEGLTPQGLWRWMSLPAMPGAWCTAMHNGLVWCNQLVVTLGQALLDLAQDARPDLAAANKTAAAKAMYEAAVARTNRAQGSQAKSLAVPLAVNSTFATFAAAEKASITAEYLQDDEYEDVLPQLDKSWDWALRRLDEHLFHPAQQYLAEAVVAKDQRDSDADNLLQAGERALAPVSAGGSACSGANLAWYMQYGKPKLVKSDKAGRTMLQLRPLDMEAVSSIGHMYAWNLGGNRANVRLSKNGTPRGWVAVISGSIPCSAFRAWLSVKVDYPSVSANSTSTGSSAHEAFGSSDAESLREKLEAEARREMTAPARSFRHNIEVTSLAAPLPAVTAAGKWPIRQEGVWPEVERGRNYQSRGGWLLLLPDFMVVPLLEQSGGAPLLEGLRNTSLGNVNDTFSGGSGRGKPVITLQLTLWLAAPTYAPAFHVIAETLEPAMQPTAKPQRMLVPLTLPYLTDNSAGCPTDLMACFVRWLALYKYAAVQITQVNSSGQKVSGVHDGQHEKCLYPTVIIGGTGNDSVGTRQSRLLQVSTNHTCYSLEVCATDPGGCSAVVALLDPACDYNVDLVPYFAERLAALLLANVGRLWLGAQFVALLAVLAATKAAAAASKAARIAASEASEAPPEGAFRRTLAPRWSLKSLLSLQWETVCTLQAGLLRRGTITWILATSSFAAYMAAVLSHPDKPWILLPGLSPLNPLLEIDASTRRNGPDSKTLLIPSEEEMKTFAEDLQQMAKMFHLCTRPRRFDCGWGDTSERSKSAIPIMVASSLPLRLLVPVMGFILLAIVIEPTVGSALSALDWSFLAVVSVLLIWVLAMVLQAAIIVIQALFCLPRWIVHWLWRAFGSQPRRALTTDQQDASFLPKVLASWGWIGWLIPLALVVAVAGAYEVIPNLMLLLSVINLAFSLCAPPVCKSRAEGVTRVQELTEQWHLMEYRRRLAWFLYYAAYATCAVPAVAAALRRLVLHREQLKELVSTTASLVQWCRSQYMQEPFLRDGGPQPQWFVLLIKEHEALLQRLLDWLESPLTERADQAFAYVSAAAQCSTMVWQGISRVAAPPRKPSFLLRVLATLISFLRASMCLLLALAWWLGSLDAGHIVVYGLSVMFSALY